MFVNVELVRSQVLKKNSIHLFACGIFALFFEFNFYKGVFAKHIRMHTMYIILYQEYIYDTTEQPETSRLEVSFLQLQRKCTNIGIETLCKHLFISNRLMYIQQKKYPCIIHLLKYISIEGSKKEGVESPPPLTRILSENLDNVW